MDELDEIRQKEEELFDDLIEPKDKLKYRHPLFIFLAVIALLAIMFFAVDYFIMYYSSWRKKLENRQETPKISQLVDYEFPIESP